VTKAMASPLPLTSEKWFSSFPALHANFKVKALQSW
jgi:hypothetical protein